jgi:mRNA interferase RelE/StbE
MYKIEVAPAAERALKKLPAGIQQRIVKAIEDLAAEPRHGSTKLQGEHSLYRIRVGDYRVIYEVADKILTVLVLKIGHRGEIYQRLR